MLAQSRRSESITARRTRRNRRRGKTCSKRSTNLDCRPSTNYMEKLQRDITPSMRGILIDWLVEVSEEYKLVPDTLYLTVNLIDRFLSKNYMEKTRLQLLGVTCMLIASAYEAMLCYTLLLESEAEENMGHFSGPLACMGHSSHSFSMFRLDLLPHSRCCLAWRQSQFH
ncbi:uncharacterized protein LOC132185682 isoform X1 [Corylus avellana]|uniref:uncharacterized protein LOC132185682 isoform X1 n=1 Tax=Corylus avellana TaxID=13451 RepID=UPI00286AC50A|nr:uncharacterized protein LOC132185682 isoform X1 [Corylus avellana]